jgi:hypothetical protein
LPENLFFQNIANSKNADGALVLRCAKKVASGAAGHMIGTAAVSLG